MTYKKVSRSGRPFSTSNNKLPPCTTITRINSNRMQQQLQPWAATMLPCNNNQMLTHTCLPISLRPHSLIQVLRPPPPNSKPIARVSLFRPSNLWSDCRQLQTSQTAEAATSSVYNQLMCSGLMQQLQPLLRQTSLQGSLSSRPTPTSPSHTLWCSISSQDSRC